MRSKILFTSIFLLAFLLLLGGAAHATSTFVFTANSNSNTISEIDVGTNTVVRNISTGDASYPYGVIINPAGTYAYFTNYNLGQVGFISLGSGEITQIVNVGGSPAYMAISKTGETLYILDVANKRVTALNTITLAQSHISLGYVPLGIAITHNGAELYVTCGDGNTRVISTASNTITYTISTGSYALGVVASDDDNYVYVTDSPFSGSAHIYQISTASHTVVGSKTLLTSYNVDGITIATNGDLYVCFNGLDQVSAISPTTWGYLANISVTNPRYITSYGGYVYSSAGATYTNNVAIIDINTNTVSSTITVGNNIQCIIVGILAPETAQMQPQYVSFILHNGDYSTSPKYPGGYISVYDNGTLIDSKITGADSSATFILVPKLYSFNYSYLADDALSFDGASSYVNISSSGGVYNSPGGVYSVEFIMDSTYLSSPSYYDFYGEGNTTGILAAFTIGTDDIAGARYARVFIRDDNNVVALILTGDINVLDGKPHRISWIDNNGTYSLYVDGVLDKSGSYTRPASLTVNRINIGALTRTATLYYYHGILSDMRLWTNARTQSQVQQYQYTRLAGSESGLKAYYKLDEGTGTTADDLTANNYDGTITAGTWTSMGWPPTGADGSFQLTPIESRYWICITTGVVTPESLRPAVQQPQPISVYVTNWFFSSLPNTTVMVYDSGVLIKTGYTDITGQYVYNGYTTTMYTIRVINSSLGVDQSGTYYGSNSYQINVFTWGWGGLLSSIGVGGGGTGDRLKDVRANLTSTMTGGGTGLINMTLNDSSLSTTSIVFQVYQLNSTGSLILVRQQTNNSVYNATANFTIPGVAGNSYRANVSVVSTAYGSFTVDTWNLDYAAPKIVVPILGPTSDLYPWISFFVCVIVMALFSPISVHYAPIITCGVAWLFWYIGWMVPIAGSQTGTAAMLGILTMLSVLIIMKDAINKPGE